MINSILEKQLIECLMNADPYKVILFGSYAYGQPGLDSDIDLLVVTQDDFLPGSFAEKNGIYLSVSETLTALEKKYQLI